MKLPKNVQKAVDVLTDDPKVKAACEIESHIKKLDDAYREAAAMRDALPSLRGAAEAYIDGPWLKDWRWRPRNAEGEVAPEIPADWLVKATSINCEKEHIRVFLLVRTKQTIPLPKGLHKPWRFAVRCKKEEKRKTRLTDLAKMVVKLYNWPENEWLQPRLDVSSPWVYVDRQLELKVPYTAEHKGLIAREAEAKKSIEAADKARDEFRRLLPTPVKEMLSVLHSNHMLNNCWGPMIPPWVYLARR